MRNSMVRGSMISWHRLETVQLDRQGRYTMPPLALLNTLASVYPMNQWLP